MSGNGSNGNGTTREIVAKLWNLCNVLRDDGITYSGLRHRADVSAVPENAGRDRP